jgi:D-alanyl-D-alanine carboxypeptidase (penicillin-binding protein 5/6)
VIPRAVALTTPVGQPAQPRAVARFEGPIPAPIAKGTKLGSVAVTMPDGRVMEHPLEAGSDVTRLGAFGRVATLLKHYLFGWLS